MKSLTPQRYLLVSFLALIVSMLGMSDAVRAQGQSGTTLSATKTATGFYERRITYTWTLTKSVTPLTVEIDSGDTQQVTYTISATRTASPASDTFGVRGEICVTNGGAVATGNLAILDVVQTKLGSGSFQNYVSQPVNLSAKPQLSPGESYCYPYEVTFAPGASGTLYRNEAQVTITNHSGHLGTPFGPAPKAEFSLPTAPTLVETDETATVTEVEMCPAGFTCLASALGPFVFMATDSVSFTKDITNETAACNSNFNLPNTATLVTNDTATTLTANALVGITTPECPPVIVGCTLTQGFWKNHPEAWLVTTLTLGTVSYTQQQLLLILDQSVQGNGLVSLAHQLIAAKLNVATGATTPAGVANDITSADSLIGGLVVPPIGTGSLAPSATSGLESSLDAYNNGLAAGGAPHCD